MEKVRIGVLGGKAGAFGIEMVTLENGGIPMEIPNLRNKEEREKQRK